MKLQRNNFFYLAFIFMIALFFVTSTYAQSGDEGGLHMVCLTASADQGGHHASLTGSPFYPDKKVEIWRKVNGHFERAGFTRQEGNDNDFSIDNNITANQIIGNLLGKLTLDSDGLASTEEPERAVSVHSATADETVHTFYGVQQISAEVIGAEQTALKLSTFFPPVGGLSSCVSVEWDPYGIVFDTVSLEPIPSALVSLYKNSVSSGNLVPAGPGVPTNPDVVKADGMFNFIVPDGDYFLLPSLATHTYPAPPSEITRLQTSQTIYKDLYTGAVIQQRGSIQHRDIPMVPKDPNNPAVNPPVIEVDITSYCVGTACYQLAYGRCSHPRCIVKAYNGGIAIPGAEEEVGDNRSFEIEIANSLIDQTKPLEFRGEKQPLNAPAATPTSIPTPTPVAYLKQLFQQLLSWVSGNAYAQQTTTSNTVRLNPIPSYLEGYAYDKSLKTVPNAKVIVRIPQMNNRIAAITFADENGYVTLPRTSTPPTTFNLLITDRNNKQINSLNTAAFITLNKPYYAEKKVNLLSPPDIEKDSTTSGAIDENVQNPQNIQFSQGAPGTIPGPTSPAAPGPESLAAAASPQSNNSFVLISVVFILVILGIGGLVLYLRRKK